MSLIKKIISDGISVFVYPSRKEMGTEAAKQCSKAIKYLLKTKDKINMLFAAAPSQNEFLNALICEEGIEWHRIRAFHLDEYIGLNSEAPQNFGNFLYKALFSKVKFAEVFYIKTEGSVEEQCLRYENLIKENPADIACIGIGENGHIAFNDPDEADFKDNKLVKTVNLDPACRLQQVNDGCFKDLTSVPQKAITLTITAIMKASYIICTVPNVSKAKAVFDTVRGNIIEKCPASILRNNKVDMFCDVFSAKHILFRKSVITDEISQDFDVAIKLAKKYNLEGVEIRSVWDTAPEALTDIQISRIKEILKQNGLKAVALSSSIFKCNVGENDTEKIQKSIKVAKKLGCRFIRCFSFWKSNDYSDNMFIEILKGCESILRENGIMMLLEFDPAVNITNGKSSAAILQKLHSPYIGAIWDPGNDIYERYKEIPFPDGYNYIKPYISHIHLKDAVRTENGTVGVAFGKGEVDYINQLKAFLNDGYDGFMSMETHYKKKNAISEDLLKNPGGKEFSKLGYESTEECLENLDVTIDSVLKEISKS